MAFGRLKILIAGIGGYGRMYVRHLIGYALPEHLRDQIEIVGAADPTPERCDRYSTIISRGIPVFPSIESFFAKHSADLTIIATPVHLHGRHIRLALEHGSHVLCEKPLASSMRDVRELLRLRLLTRRQVAVGYQWSWSSAVQALRTDVASGRLGRPVRFRTLVLWPRGDQYYSRNNWAGRMMSNGGLPVLDSPLNNACAHFVHNAFYILGDAFNPQAYPSALNAELYRARDIESYDTAAVRCMIGDDVEAIFVASHAVSRRVGPVFRYEFENAVVSYDDTAEADGIVARFDDGTVKRYGVPGTSDNPAKIWNAIECAQTGRMPLCSLEAAAAQTAFACAAHESSQQIVSFPLEMIEPYHDLAQGRIACVSGLDAALTSCYETMQLPSELGCKWSRPSKTVAIPPLFNNQPASAVVGSEMAKLDAPHIEVTLMPTVTSPSKSVAASSRRVVAQSPDAG